MEIFASMEHQRLQPDVITYSSLISVCEKGKNPERAMKIFASMEHERVQTDLIGTQVASLWMCKSPFWR